MKKNILGVKIDDISINKISEIVFEWLKGKGKHYIVTPNPEILVMAQKDAEFKKILNNANLSIPDGAGLKLSGDIDCTSPGIDVLEALVKMASENGFTTGFLGGRNEVAKKTAERLKKKYKNLKISFASGDIEVDKDGKSLKLLNKKLKLPDTDLLFVAFGPPKQEKWIAKNFSKLSVKVVMGVGGSFDVFGGKIPRAPKWLRNLGFEWLFRLTIQPWRLFRQLTLLKYLYLLLIRH